MVRQLINYHPEWLRDIKEIQVISEIQQEQSENISDALDSVWNNNFLSTLDENGCARWESMLGLKKASTLEERRAVIASKVVEIRPFTYGALKQMLNNILGEDGYWIALYPNTYTLVVSIKSEKMALISSVQDLLDRIVPANIVWSVAELLYNTHGMLQSLKHTELSEYTHEEVREDTSIV